MFERRMRINPGINVIIDALLCHFDKETSFRTFHAGRDLQRHKHYLYYILE